MDFKASPPRENVPPDRLTLGRLLWMITTLAIALAVLRPKPDVANEDLIRLWWDTLLQAVALAGPPIVVLHVRRGGRLTLGSYLWLVYGLGAWLWLYPSTGPRDSRLCLYIASSVVDVWIVLGAALTGMLGRKQLGADAGFTQRTGWLMLLGWFPLGVWFTLEAWGIDV